MSKLRVTDMAGEFGIPADEVINILRQMDIPVRSHVSPLTDDQVARVRARWEREKRARSAAPAPAAGARRRRGAAAAPETPAPEPEPSHAVRRRRAADVVVPERLPAVPEPSPVTASAEPQQPAPVAAQEAAAPEP
ncbi:MAG: translation initiation factor IF-2 N-terminal domain-containing protein, partial [Gemmatimonadota bacterium]|nr:translation initiation factor IF-2 N-terminal domain-containing protein [Gemmatimonadota bacterium]